MVFSERVLAMLNKSWQNTSRPGVIQKSRPKSIDNPTIQDKVGALSIKNWTFLCVCVILDHVPTDLWRSLEKGLLFFFAGGEQMRVYAFLHSSLSGSGIELSIRIISVDQCDTWAVLSLTLWVLSFTFTFDLFVCWAKWLFPCGYHPSYSW